MEQTLQKKQYLKIIKQYRVNLDDQGVEKALRKSKLKKASIVSNDNYIIDGHLGSGT